MLEQAELIGFVATTDADRARAFYVDVLGLEFVTDDNFAIVVRSGQNMIRIARVPSFTPAPHTILGWEVPDVTSAVRSLAAAGVATLRFSFLNQDDDGIWLSPNGSRVAWFNDPDGNVLSFSQHTV